MIRTTMISMWALLLLTTYSAPERFEWSETRPLQWSDFKGSPESLQGWAASSSTGISQAYGTDAYGYLDKSAVTVKAHFYPQYSWVRHQEKTRHLLRHEQTHFDITEVYARKLAKKIEDATFTSNSLEEIKTLYQEIEKERVATQQLFDKESNHSLNHPEEIKWEFKVKRWLKDLD